MLKYTMKVKLIAKILLMCAVAAHNLTASPPVWWGERGVGGGYEGEITPQIVAQNYEVANVGQLKHIAKRAAEELDEKLANVGGAGESVSALIDSFKTYSSNEVGYNPQSNYDILNLGQLKAVAKLFYDRLHEVNAAFPESVMWPAGMALDANAADLHPYPWNPMPSVESPDYAESLAQNYLSANIGQLKYLFAWSINTANLPAVKDSNNNAIDDDWEIKFFGRLLNLNEENEDFDLDGLSNLEEFLSGTNPNNPDSDGDNIYDGVDGNPLRFDISDFTDTDGDGIPDQWELGFGLNIYLPDGDLDDDADGLTNFEEFTCGSDPFNSDTDGDGRTDAREVAYGNDPLDRCGGKF